jgi:hypothetical protein
MFKTDRTQFGGLFPTTFHPDHGHFTTGPFPPPIFPIQRQLVTFFLAEIKFGARGDSFYEYLLKQYLQTGRTEEKIFDVYKQTMEGPSFPVLESSQFCSSFLKG